MLTASLAAGLSGLCAGYVVVTRPLLRPAEGVDHRPFQFTATPLDAAKVNQAALRYLPDQPWAATAEWVVHNGRSILFCNSCEQITSDSSDPGRTGSEFRLEPFAMILPPDPGKPDDEAVTIAASSATLRVAGSLEFEQADPGRITGGRMPGAVRLRGPDGLDVQGTDFHFDEKAQRVWSDKAVDFAHGPHSGRGHGLQLELFRVADPETYDAVAVNGVRVVRLLRDVEMDLQIADDSGGPFGSLDGSATTNTVTANANSNPGESSQPTKVTCSGSFTFDVDRNEAVFTQDVVASRAVPGQPPDQLECDILTVGFEPSTEEAKHDAAERRAKIASKTLTEDDGFQSVDDDLAVIWLKANQSPDSPRPAQLRSPSNTFVADFSQLAWDAVSGVTTLSREGGAVEARQKSSTLVSPIVTLEPATGDAPPTIVCVGRGWLQHFDDQGQPALTAHWTDSLRRLRADDGLDLIRLIGEARVEQPLENFALGGDRIDLWLDPRESADDSAAQGESLVAASDMKPVRLLAVSLSEDPDPRKNLRVKLRSPELLADATRLEVEFVDPPPPETTAARRTRLKRSTLSPVSKRILQTSADRAQTPPPAPPPETPEFLPPRAPSEESPVPAEPSAKAPADTPEGDTTPAPTEIPREPIELAARVIKVIAERSRETGDGPSATAPASSPNRERSGQERQGQVREVHTTGGVIVRQKRAEDEPLLIEGDRLDLFNRGVERELVHIYGTPEVTEPDGRVTRKAAPARVHDQGATLFGLNINLDRATNRAWVEGQGVLEMPARGAAGAMRLDDDADSDAEPPAALDGDEPEPELLTVWWHDSMEFDGDRANFFGDVQTQLQSNLMTCQEMEVRLTSRFDFAAADRRGPRRTDDDSRAEVAEIICRHRVRVDGEIREGDTLAELRHAEFNEFRLDQQTGDTRAIGPGWIEVWRRGDGNRASLAADNAVRANTSIPHDKPTWEYMFIEFSRTSDGNIHRRTTTFRNDVRVVYGPVDDTTQKIDPHRPDKAPAEAGWMTCKELTLTRHRKSEDEPEYSAVLGEGNVRIAGRGFAGVADWVSYDESKGQYVLKSFGKRTAIVSRSNIDGQGAGEFPGQQITFYPATGKIKVDKGSGGSWVQ